MFSINWHEAVKGGDADVAVGAAVDAAVAVNGAGRGADDWNVGVVYFLCPFIGLNVVAASWSVAATDDPVTVADALVLVDVIVVNNVDLDLVVEEAEVDVDVLAAVLSLVLVRVIVLVVVESDGNVITVGTVVVDNDAAV